jgi:hypothetical protein
MRIDMGASAFAFTGEKSAIVDRVIIEPEDWTATHLVLAKGDILASDKLLPIDMVQAWTERGVLLRLTLDDIRRLPDYIAREYATVRQFLPAAQPPKGGNVPSPEVFTQEGKPFGPGLLPHRTQPFEGKELAQQPVPSGPIQLRDGATVEAVDGIVGYLDQLLLDPLTNRVSSLIIKRDGQLFDVPVEWVAYIDPDCIRLATTKEQAEHLVGPPAGNFLVEEPERPSEGEGTP